ncbi:unnamed protein product [Rotaria sordida]|uniref:Uncharacterized protein n=1 Tax=Rotaria sordida TaxID=392033 RepID=A0A819U4K4_9BILA|nr:unnamed protein product [Rotaria sordida]
MLSLIQVMKTIGTFFNNYRINRNVYNINTNTTIDRIECERNVCEKELHRLKYGLENLLKNKAHKNFQIRKTNWIDQCWSCCRRCTRNRNHNNTYMNKHRDGYHSTSQSSFFRSDAHYDDITNNRIVFR